MIDFSAFGIQIPEIYLPQTTVDLQKWAVVACDQYTSQLEYWEEVAKLVGDAPSTLQLIFPEVYLGTTNETERIALIKRQMQEYLESGVLVSQGLGFIYVERQTSHQKLRKGLMVALDLECYNYQIGATSLIRATEGTVLERIPPRVKIRSGASLELPHIMVLFDDPQGLVLEPLAAKVGQLKKLYETELMMNGGKVTGYQVQEESLLAGIRDGLAELMATINNEDPLLFAVGDGNHSLATAKAVWEETKLELTTEELATHPARYALVELVNLHDSGMVFEPIHRVVFNCQLADLQQAIARYNTETGARVSLELTKQLEGSEQHEATHCVELIGSFGEGSLIFWESKFQLAVGAVQNFLDYLSSWYSELSIDYIHGADVVAELGVRPGNIGLYLPPMAKEDLFKTVIKEGVLPRKTFSMGEAEEKRFYLEARRITCLSKE